RDKVAVDVKAEKAKDLAASKAKQAEEMFKSGKDLSTVAKAVESEIKTSDLLTRGAVIPEFGSIGELDKEVFSLPIGKPGTPLSVSGKTIAFAVKERQPINPDEMKKSFDTVRSEILPQRREQYFSAYIQDVRKKMESNKKIKINDSVVTQIAQQIS